MYNEPVGQILSDARIKLGKSIKEVEFDTKIRAKYIKALELNDYSSLPPNIYTQGFIKTYAQYLGLDPQPLIQQHKGLYGQPGSDLSQLSANIKVKKKGQPRWFKPAVAIGAVAGLFFILLAWGAWQQSAARGQKVIVQDIKTKPTSTTVAAATTTTSVAAEKKTIAATEEKDIPEGDGVLDVVVKLTGINNTGSWVRVTVDGEKAYEGIIKDGTTKLFKGDSEIKLRVGNITGLEVMFDGKVVKSSSFTTENGIATKTFEANGTKQKSKSSRKN